jgi:hypothetical protein
VKAIAALADAGYLKLDRVLPTETCTTVLAKLADANRGGVGSRCLLAQDWCQALVECLRVQPALAGLLPGTHRAVQCSYFEKSLSRNWLVPVHQDLSLPVAARVDDPTLRGWSEKEGELFVQAPRPVLEQLLALRLHLDPCAADDGPLQVVPGTHRDGLLSPEQAVQLRQLGPVETCLMQAGDALLLRPLLLHASSKSSGSGRRRVLHFLFGPAELPAGLRWRRAF